MEHLSLLFTFDELQPGDIPNVAGLVQLIIGPAHLAYADRLRDQVNPLAQTIQVDGSYDPVQVLGIEPDELSGHEHEGAFTAGPAVALNHYDSGDGTAVTAEVMGLHPRMLTRLCTFFQTAVSAGGGPLHWNSLTIAHEAGGAGELYELITNHEQEITSRASTIIEDTAPVRH